MAKVNLYPDFRELLESLNSARVKYLVLGGYAVIYYGYRRATDDLDIWIETSPENSRRVSEVLQDFGGFSPAKVKPSLFQKPGMVFICGREPVRVDFLTGPSGLDFDTSYAKRRIVNWDGIKVPLIDMGDLKTNKRSAGRAKDLADLENLPAHPAKKSRRRKRH
jgi:predicted nucleotidyltransferase